MKVSIYNICIGICLLLATSIHSLAAAESYGFRVYLKDKAGSPHSVEQPGTFLSAESIQRRIDKGKPITVADIPVSPVYIEVLTTGKTTPVATSKWMNTVVVMTIDSLVGQQLAGLSMVDSVKWVWKGAANDCTDSPRDTSRLVATETPLKSAYGYAEKQIRMHNGDKLHEHGFRGEGMRVAVIDAGFLNVDRIAAFDSLRLIGARNMLSPDCTVFDDDEHGTKVLSCLAANAPGQMTGTAPHASYLLLKSEDRRSEYPIEEDYWVAAAEYADSVGVDVITSSLGYFEFDSTALNYTPDALDGHTAFISRAASRIAEKGILLLSSAGNEGNGRWEKITFPADVETLLTVGAVMENKKRSSFSSFGPAAGGRVKPDLAALGTGCCVVDETGNIRYANGTSFATPIMAGLAVCLWQALPSLSNTEIMELLRQSSSRAKKPDAEQGYGLPDVYKAYKEGRRYVSAR